MSKDLKLDGSTHDLVIENGDLQFVEETEEVAQRVKIRLLFWYGEWILNYNKGVKYIDGIYSISKSQEFKDQEIKRAILGTPGIQELIDYSFGVDTTNQTASIEFEATSVYGDIVVEIVT